MLIVVLFEFVALALLILVFATQIVVPFLRGTPTFPIFRKERKLMSELTRAMEKVAEVELEQRIKEEKERAGAIKGEKQCNNKKRRV